MADNFPPHEEFLSFAIGLADIVRPMVHVAEKERQNIEIKMDGSFVTQTDKAIELELRLKIENTYPNHGIFGEEQGNKNLNAEFVWVIDPIDGTAPFIAGIPVYGSLISLAWKGKPFIGIIEHPATNDRWMGVTNKFATYNDQPAHIKSCESLSKAFATCSNPDFMNETQRLSFERVKEIASYVQYGGACFAYGALANGKTDLAIDAGLQAFDLFAPAAVISGAGGVVTDWEGMPLNFSFQGDVIAAGDKRVHSEVLTRLNAPEF